MNENHLLPEPQAVKFRTTGFNHFESAYAN